MTVLESFALRSLKSMSDYSMNMSETTDRLSSRLKVRSAADDAIKYFKAQSFESRFKDLDDIKSNINLGQQIVSTALSTLDGMKDILSSMKSIATEARQTSDGFKRAELAAEYNNIKDQLVQHVKDGHMDGVNLLNGGDNFVVQFNEENTSRLTFEAIDFQDVSGGVLGLADIAEGTIGSQEVTLDAAVTLTSKLTDITTGGGNKSIEVGDVISFSKAGSTDGGLGTISVTQDMTVGDFLNAVNKGVTNVKAKFNGSDKITFEGAELVDISNSDATDGAFEGEKITDAVASGFLTNTQVSLTRTSIDDAIGAVKNHSAKIGRQSAIMDLREKFIGKIISHLRQGQSDLVVANLNEETAIMSANKNGFEIANQSFTMMSSSRSQAIFGMLRRM